VQESGTADVTDLTSLSSEKADGDWPAEHAAHTVNGEALRDLVEEYNADCNGLAITVVRAWCVRDSSVDYSTRTTTRTTATCKCT